MKKHLSTILCILIFVVGLSIMLYPTVSNYINSKSASRVIADYNASLADASPEDITAWLNVARDYNRTLAITPDAFFFPELVEGYEDTLNIMGNGIMGYIDVDKENIHLPIYHGVSDSVLQVGVGHLPGTSMPIGGTSTHSVLSGHTGLPSSRLFTDLYDLEIGDTFTITVANRTITYQIDQIVIVLPEETDELQIVPGKDYCTLFTCYPYGVNSHRMLLRGVRINNIEGDDEDRLGAYVANEAFRVDPLIISLIVGTPMLIILLTALAISDRIKKNDFHKGDDGNDEKIE